MKTTILVIFAVMLMNFNVLSAHPISKSEFNRLSKTEFAGENPEDIFFMNISPLPDQMNSKQKNNTLLRDSAYFLDYLDVERADMYNARYRFTYNEQNRIAARTMYDIDKTEEVPTAQITFHYNEKGLLVLEESKKWGTDSWNDFSRETYTYDDNDNLIQWLQERNYDGEWRGMQRWNYEYDDNGRMTSLEKEFWTVDDFEKQRRTTYTWGFPMAIVKEVDEYWLDGEWTLVMTTYYEYSTNIDLCEMKYSFPNHPEEYAGRRLYYYGEFLDSEIFSGMSDGEWIDLYKNTYTYDDNWNLLLDYYEKNKDGVWSEHIKTSYSYDDNSNEISRVYEVWQNDTWQKLYDRNYTYNSDNLITHLVYADYFVLDHTIGENTDQYFGDSYGNGAFYQGYDFMAHWKTEQNDEITLIIPENFERIQNNSINFSWSSQQSAPKYRLQIARDKNFTDLITDMICGEPQANIYFSETYNNYYWRVQAVDGDWYGSFSDTRTFYIWYTCDVAESGEQHGIEVYPNPSDGMINIAMPEKILAESIEVYDMLGQKIYSEQLNLGRQSLQMNIDAIPGEYFIYIKAQDKYYSYPIIIE